MINIDLRLSLPTSTRWRPCFIRSGKLGKHKAWELCAHRTNTIVCVYFRTQVGGDHPGVFMMIGLFGIDIEVNVYDTRHEEEA